MLQGISITCFAASYSVALALEVSRLWFRSGVRGAVMIGFAAAGLLAHTLFLTYRAMTAVSAPLSSEYDWYLIAAWSLAVLYLYLTICHPKNAFGLFTLPVVLALIAVGRWFADEVPFPVTQAATYWGLIHALFLLLGYLAVIIGFVGGAMALVQTYRLKHKHQQPQGLKLPSLEWLEHLNQRALVISVAMFAVGLISGAVLNAVNRKNQVDQLAWNDPIVWSSTLVLAWLAVAAGFVTFYRPARQGRKVAYLTIVSFLFLVLTIAVRLMLPTGHAPVKQAEGIEPQRHRGHREEERVVSDTPRVLYSLHPSSFILHSFSVSSPCPPCLRGAIPPFCPTEDRS